MNQGQTEFGLNKKIPNNSRFAIGLVSFSVEILWLQKVCIFENKIVKKTANRKSEESNASFLNKDRIKLKQTS
jgi:hypothetical protein